MKRHQTINGLRLYVRSWSPGEYTICGLRADDGIPTVWASRGANGWKLRTEAFHLASIASFRSLAEAIKDAARWQATQVKQ